MKPILKLDWCSHAAAKYAVEHWHYSKVLPLGKLIKIGIWEDRTFIGCILFARANTPNMGKRYGLVMTQICELARVALTHHQTPVTRICRIALCLLQKSNPGLKLVVSFADPDHGHHGGIYQAGNWIYCGMSHAELQFFDAGRWKHRREVVSQYCFGNIRQMPDYKHMPNRLLPGKHRYLYPLDAAMRAQILPLAQPYPKRAVSTAASAPVLQAGEGGSSPTTALDS